MAGLRSSGGLSKSGRTAWVFGICLAAGTLWASTAFAVVSNDPGYTASLLSSGLSQPANGVLFRAGFNDVLVSEYGSSEVTSVDPSTGAKTLFAPIPPRFNSGPSEVAINSQGDVYVNEHVGGPIYRFSSTGAPLSPASFFPPDCSSFAGMAFDAADNFYLTCIPSSFDGKIIKFALNTFTSPTVFASGLPTLLGIQFSPAGKLFAAGFDTGKIFEIAPGGTTLGSHTQWASGLNCPANVAFDPASGDVFASSTDTVVRMSSPGNVTTFASGFPWDGVVGDCDGTYALDFDPQGCLYVDEFTSGELWKFCPSGSSPAAPYPAPRFASPVRAPLVPVLKQCGSAGNPINASHAPPLALGSCTPPRRSSVATFGPQSVGDVQLATVFGDTNSANGDQADVRIRSSLADIETGTDADYDPNPAGADATLVTRLRLTDRANGGSGTDPGTATDLDFSVPVVCTATTDSAAGSTCALDTTVDAVMPGLIKENKATVLQTFRFRLNDSGVNGIRGDSDDKIFATQGLFVP